MAKANPLKTAPQPSPEPATVGLVLTQPFDHGGVHYTELTLRRPRVKDFIAVERQIKLFDLAGQRVATMALTVSVIADIPLDAAHEMDYADLSAADDTITDFLSSLERPDPAGESPEQS